MTCLLLLSFTYVYLSLRAHLRYRYLISIRSLETELTHWPYTLILGTRSQPLQNPLDEKKGTASKQDDAFVMRVHLSNLQCLTGYTVCSRSRETCRTHYELCASATRYLLLLTSCKSSHELICVSISSAVLPNSPFA